jgi:hypothetical protein
MPRCGKKSAAPCAELAASPSQRCLRSLIFMLTRSGTAAVGTGHTLAFARHLRRCTPNPTAHLPFAERVPPHAEYFGASGVVQDGWGQLVEAPPVVAHAEGPEGHWKGQGLRRGAGAGWTARKTGLRGSDRTVHRPPSSNYWIKSDANAPAFLDPKQWCSHLICSEAPSAT